MNNQKITAIETVKISLNRDTLPLKRFNCKTSNRQEGKRSQCIFPIESLLVLELFAVNRMLEKRFGSIWSVLEIECRNQ